MPPKKKTKRKPRQIYLKKVIRYRDKKTGYYTKKKRGARREEYIHQVTKTGKVLRTLEVFTTRTSHITTRPDALDKPIDPNDRGLISQALAEKKILSTSRLKGAKRIEITVKGKDTRSKLHRFKAVWDVSGEKDLANLMVGRLQAMLASKGYRTQYKLTEVDWKNKKGNKTHSRNKKILRDMQIVVKVKK